MKNKKFITHKHTQNKNDKLKKRSGFYNKFPSQKNYGNSFCIKKLIR